ncbi:MAG: GNAT family N-acetyltransferase [Chloroflexia bacterium]
MTEAGPLLIRPARAEDREPVLAFCARTWNWGDYLPGVWNDWMADPRGLFAVGEVGGQVIGVDKLTFLSDDEAFFEGLRIDPDYRSQGYAGRFQRHMLEEAARQGARVVRFLTAADNTAVHLMAERDGFRRGPTLLHWTATPDPNLTGAPQLTALAPGNTAYKAWAAFQRGPIWAALGGLLSYSWHAVEWTPARWAAMLGEGGLFVTPPAADGAPGDLLAFMPDLHDPEQLWLAGMDAPLDADRIAVLARAARAHASQGYTTIQAMLPRLPEIESGLRAASWDAEEQYAMLLFEKVLRT